MNKTVVISVILFHVIGMAEFRKFAEELTRLIEMDCNSFRTQSKLVDFIGFDRLTEKMPPGYKVKFQLSVVPNKTAAIVLSTAKGDFTDYEIHLSTVDDIYDVFLFRNSEKVAHDMYSPTEIADVTIAITDDNTVTVTVDGKKLITYNEIDPFAINYFGFGTFRDSVKDEARFYYNCKSKASSNASQMETAQCGKRKVDRQPLITSAFRAKEGDWPWHAAIWHSQDERRSYACGGTLITADAVITAAHCLYQLGRPIVPRRVFVQLGKHDFQLAGPNTQEFRADQLIIHSDYNQNTFKNDIGIIRLANVATFTRYVQPICLWDANRVTLDAVIGRNGTVVGWGFNEHDKLPEALDQAYMPVVSIIDCLASDQDFFGSSIFRGTFCAGFRNGTIVCNGDSGGGMYFIENGSYTLRGIVSRTKARSGADNLCDTQSYVIFTDVAFFLKWIQENTK